MPGDPARPLNTQRIDQLVARVRWLDRYRRVLAISGATIVAPILVARVAEALGAEWPPIHATIMSVMLGAIAWWIIEVGLVYLTALWETEHDHLVRDRGLPRAILHKPRLR
jgi:hypothetical protein